LKHQILEQVPKLRRQLQEVNVNKEQAHLPKHAYSSTSDLTTTNKIMLPLISNTNQKPSSILWPSGLVNHKETEYLKPVHFAFNKLQKEEKKAKTPLIQGPPNIQNKPIKNLCD